jgi:polyphosphate glucokinase
MRGGILKVLVVDIGGSRVKLYGSATRESASFPSGARMSPAQLMAGVRSRTLTWEFDVVSVGYPGSTGPDGVSGDAGNLGDGWVGFDFAGAFDRPVRVVNDAALQALGAYDGGRMLFLGLGTGLGSAIIGERVIMPLELGTLPHPSGETLADHLGATGLARLGLGAWQDAVRRACQQLRAACRADYVVLGGGNGPLVSPLPVGARHGRNEDAFAGGVRIWEEWVEHHDLPPSNSWRVVW